MKYNTPFAERFRALRENIGISQSEMADKLGISQQSISFYEKGERLPDYYVLNKICEETGCSIGYLFGKQEYMSDRHERMYQNIGLKLSDIAMHRLQNGECAEGLEKLLNTPAMWYLISLIQSACSQFDYEKPATSNIMWDYYTYVCSRVLDEVMDDIYDTLFEGMDEQAIELFKEKAKADLDEIEGEPAKHLREPSIQVKYTDSSKSTRSPLEKIKTFKTLLE